jgi:hypothetical protein
MNFLTIECNHVLTFCSDAVHTNCQRITFYSNDVCKVLLELECLVRTRLTAWNLHYCDHNTRIRGGSGLIFLGLGRAGASHHGLEKNELENWA